MKFFKYIIIIICLVVTNNITAKTNDNCLNFHVIHSEPIGYFNKNNQPTGIHWEYIEAIEKHSGLCINLTLLPYSRLWKEIEYGRHDGGLIFKSKSRSSIVEYVDLIQITPTVIIPAKHHAINDYSDLKSLNIASMRSVHLNKKFDNDKSLTITKVLNYEQGIKMLKHDMVDAIAGNQYVLQYQINQFGAKNSVNINDVIQLGTKETWLQLSKKSKHLEKIPVLQTSIKHLKDTGVFKKIFLKYYGYQFKDTSSLKIH